jgi:hypothetical protein
MATPADQRLLELVGRWLESLELHIKYSSLDEDSYWKIQPWSEHQRPSRWILELAKQKTLALRAQVEERIKAGDAKFSDGLELMAFLANLVGSEHIERFIPVAEAQNERALLRSRARTARPPPRRNRRRRRRTNCPRKRPLRRPRSRSATESRRKRESKSSPTRPAWYNGAESGTSCPSSSPEWPTVRRCRKYGVYSRKINRPLKRRPETPSEPAVRVENRAAARRYEKFAEPPSTINAQRRP